jgi:four helix bundle protein
MRKNELSEFKVKMKSRTNKFVHDCIKFAVNLPSNSVSNHIRGQLIRCSTSAATNYRAACIAQFIPSIISKISIAIEEADESEFWIQFAIDEKLARKEKSLNLSNEAYELASILIKSRKTLQNKLL